MPLVQATLPRHAGLHDGAGAREVGHLPAPAGLGPGDRRHLVAASLLSFGGAVIREPGRAPLPGPGSRRRAPHRQGVWLHRGDTDLELDRGGKVVLPRGDVCDLLQAGPHVRERPAGPHDRGDGRPGVLGDLRRDLRPGHVPLHAAPSPGAAHLPVRRVRHLPRLGAQRPPAGLLAGQCRLHLAVPRPQAVRLRGAAEAHRGVPGQPAVGARDLRGAQAVHPRGRVGAPQARAVLRQVHDLVRGPGLADLRPRGDPEALALAVPPRHAAHHRQRGAPHPDGQLPGEKERWPVLGTRWPVDGHGHCARDRGVLGRCSVGYPGRVRAEPQGAGQA
mmetsp:Transcript_91782/g.259548  ORF Transcript_91782/g.259548 Transcript_91782/m.259548 type:complete len:333 (-) Transcript_91782:583-1581(-)